MKRTPVPVVSLSADQVRQVAASAFSLAESGLDSRFYLLDVVFEKESGAWYLRIYIEGVGFPVSLNDCEQVSRVLDPLIEELAPLKDLPYSLEVSSPGLFRPLRTAREFRFYEGRPVRILLETPTPAASRKKKAPPLMTEVAQGVLKSFDETNQTVTLLISDGRDAQEVRLVDGMQVLLNPVVQYPDDALDAIQSGGALVIEGSEP